MRDLTTFDLGISEDHLTDVPPVSLDHIPDTIPEEWHRLLRCNAKARAVWEATDYPSPSEQAYALMYVCGVVGLDEREAAAVHVGHYGRLGRKDDGVRKAPYALRAWTSGKLWAEGQRGARLARHEAHTAFQRATGTEIIPPEVEWHPAPKAATGDDHSQTDESLPAEAPAEGPVFPDIAFQGLAAEIARTYAERVEAPLSFLYMNALTYLGAAVCRCVRVRSPFEAEEPRLYTVNVARSAGGRKSSSQQLIRQFYAPLIEGRVLCSHGVGSAEGLAKRMQAGGSTLLQYDEFRSFVDKSGVQGSVLLPMVGSLFSTTHYENATKNSEIVLTDAHLSLVGACTTETFTTMFSPQFRNIGFLNRLFIVTGGRTTRKPIPEEVPHSVLKALQERARKQIERAERQRPRLEFTAGARRRWEEWYHALPETPYTARLDTYGFRLLALYAVSTESWALTLSLVDAVLALLDYQKEVRRELDPVDAEGVVARMERFILRHLSKGRMPENRLQRLCNVRHYGLWTFQQALKNLKAQDWVRVKRAGRGFVLWLTEPGIEAANE